MGGQARQRTYNGRQVCAMRADSAPSVGIVARVKWARLVAAVIGVRPSIGAGAGLDRPAETEFADLDCSSVSPAALYGYGRDDDDGAAY